MLRYIKQLIILCIGFSLVGCENFFDQEIELPNADHEPILAINSFINSTTERQVQARISRTYGLFEDQPDDDRIFGATVELYEEGNLLYQLSPFEFDEFNYVQNLNNTAFGGIGKTYELRVSHPDYPSVTATQTMPTPVPLEEIVYRPLQVNDFSNSNGEIQMTFTDPAGEENYYEFLIAKQCVFVNDQPISGVTRDTFLNFIFFNNEDLGSDPNLTQGFPYDALLISDQNFDGQRITISPQFWSSDCFGSINVEVDNFVVYWRTVTKDYFNYSKSVNDNYFSADNPFAEPVSVFSNVEGGVGAFCLRAELVYEVE